RNVIKIASRDKRSFKNQHIEYDFLAPDSVNELFSGLEIIERSVGESLSKSRANKTIPETFIRQGRKILESNASLNKRKILVKGVENSNRDVQIVKVKEAYQLFRELIRYYGTLHLVESMETE